MTRSSSTTTSLPLPVYASLLLWRIVDSPFGSVLAAIRESERRPAAMGYAVAATRSGRSSLAAVTVRGRRYSAIAIHLLHQSGLDELAAQRRRGADGDHRRRQRYRSVRWSALPSSSSSKQGLSLLTDEYNPCFSASSSCWSSRFFAAGVSLGASRPDRADGDERARDPETCAKPSAGFEVIADLDLTVPAGQRHAVIGPERCRQDDALQSHHWLALADKRRLPASTVFRFARVRPDLVTRRRPVALVPEEHAARKRHRAGEPARGLPGVSSVPAVSVPACRWRFPRSSRRRGARREQCIWIMIPRPAVSELSYGQKRQLEVAIALCAEPKILLMDEPAAGTSPQRARTISSTLINGLPRDLTIVLVEHDMDVVFAICDVITVLSYGKVLATGTKVAKFRTILR